MKTVRYAMLIATVLLATIAFGETCKPTRPDALGPFYQPNAPVRSSVGKGYVLSGTIKSAKDCSAIERAMIEFWLAGPDGEYADKYRATLFSGKSGSYRFESPVPPPYYGRPPHIHIRVTSKGYQTLVTQHYPVEGKTEAVFDIVLAPAQ
jgi:protocatechuate 3,4-dioxygenase beta subunit